MNSLRETVAWAGFAAIGAALAAGAYFLLRAIYPGLSGFGAEYALAVFLLACAFRAAGESPGRLAPVLLAVWTLIVPALGLFGALVEHYLWIPAWQAALGVGAVALAFGVLLTWLLGSRIGRWSLLALAVVIFTAYGFYVAAPHESGGRRFVLFVGICLSLLGSALATARFACRVLAADLRQRYDVSMGETTAYSSGWMFAAFLAGAGAMLLARADWWMLPAVALPFYAASLFVRPRIVRANLARELKA